MKNLHIAIFIFLIFIGGCKVVEEGNEPKAINGFENILIIANSHTDVQSYLQDKQYSVEAKLIDENDKAQMPAVYSGLEGILYQVYYRTNELDLLVITNEKEVLEVIPISKIRV